MKCGVEPLRAVYTPDLPHSGPVIPWSCKTMRRWLDWIALQLTAYSQLKVSLSNKPSLLCLCSYMHTQWPHFFLLASHIACKVIIGLSSLFLLLLPLPMRQKKLIYRENVILNWFSDIKEKYSGVHETKLLVLLLSRQGGGRKREERVVIRHFIN